jgi:hypothetical protein
MVEKAHYNLKDGPVLVMKAILGYGIGIGIALFLAVIVILYFLYRRRIGLIHRYDIVSHELDGIDLIFLMKRYSPYLDEEIEFKRMVQFVLDHFLLY